MNTEIKKYFEERQQSKNGLTFYLNGNTVNGYMTRNIDENCIGVRNQFCSKVFVFLRRLDADAMSR